MHHYDDFNQSVLITFFIPIDYEPPFLLLLIFSSCFFNFTCFSFQISGIYALFESKIKRVF
ncbi:hypothetical protein ACE6H2_026009 [Prunus campanulata]